MSEWIYVSGVSLLMCGMEARIMHKTIRMAMLVATFAVGMSVARAQIIDGSTGQIVDASSDPADFALVASGQAGNIGSEIAANDAAAFHAQVMAQNQASVDAAINSADATGDNVDITPVTPSTPKPVIGPKAVTFNGQVQVTITDSDVGARVFYTLDGKKPTASSAMYSGPIVVSAKTKVRAMAWDVNERTSGVATKTFKVKS